MSDPERLLAGVEAGDAAELERALMDSIRDVSPPVFAKEAVWNGIAAKVAAGSAVATGLASVAPKAAAAALPAMSGKIFAVVLVSGATLVGGGVWLSRSAEGPAPAHTAPMMATPVFSAPVTPPIPPPAAAPEVAEIARAPVRREQEDALGLESELLTQARSELRSGEARAALATLATLATRVPRGVLGQEREVLAIQALSAIGDDGKARRRARAFVSAHPKSPHSVSLRAIAGDP